MIEEPSGVNWVPETSTVSNVLCVVSPLSMSTTKMLLFRSPSERLTYAIFVPSGDHPGDPWWGQHCVDFPSAISRACVPSR